MNMVQYPTYIALDVLPNKTILIKHFTEYLESIDKPIPEYKIIARQIRKIIKFLIGAIDTSDTETFLKYTKDLDLLRNQSLQDQIPELYEYLQENLGYNYDDVKGNVK